LNPLPSSITPIEQKPLLELIEITMCREGYRLSIFWNGSERPQQSE